MMARYLSAISVAVALTIAVTAAKAACPTFHQLQNGTTADASQVMDDFNHILQCPNFTGNVGVGTATPVTTLTVAGAINGRTEIGFDGAVVGGGIWSVGTGWTSAGSVENLYFFESGGGTKMIIGASGNVGIGTTAPSYTLQVNGSVAGSSAYVNLSDERLKKDIHPIQNALRIIEDIHGVSFRWKTPAERSVGKQFDLSVGKPQIGFIAQEVQNVLPEAVAVANDKDRTMSVAESKVVPVLVEAVKQLDAQNRKLAAELRSQNVEMSKLKSKVASLVGVSRVSSLYH